MTPAIPLHPSMVMWANWMKRSILCRRLRFGASTPIEESAPKPWNRRKTADLVWSLGSLNWGIPQNGWFRMENPIQMDDVRIFGYLSSDVHLDSELVPLECTVGMQLATRCSKTSLGASFWTWKWVWVKVGGCMFFGPPFFWTYTCFLDLAGFFLYLGAQKMWGTCLCVFWTLWRYFLGPACICAGPRGISLDSQINCFWARFLFFGPVHLLRGPCLHKVGGNSIVIGAHIGLDVFGPWSIVSLNLYMLFWTWQRVVGMQMLRQDACKKLLMPGKFGYWNNKNVRSGGEANGGSLRMKRNGCRKLRGT